LGNTPQWGYGWGGEGIGFAVLKSVNRRVVTGCHGLEWVNMSTPLLPEVVREIFANPVSFYGEREGQTA